ncbi:MAG: IscS subfamily cysteine desulfurase [Anaerolineales bacterium]|nr:IscS subfamily cysteine desulfurase [Anaerolineales bacterium]
MSKPIYLDYNATTPIDPEVAEAMIPYLYEHFGNPSSSHTYGMQTKEAIENARSQVAKLINCSPKEIIFTSGGTESNNSAIRGFVDANQTKGRHIITTAVEHPAVIEVCNWLDLQGFQTTILPVNQFGMVSPSNLEKAITPGTILVTIMHANNEVGTIQPIRQLAQIARNRGVAFHTDAAQSVGKLVVDVQELGVDMLSIAGHKLYAPKGIGAIFVRQGIQLSNLMFGAGQEGGRRPGTENVLEIVALGKACEIVNRDLKVLQSHFQKLRNQLHHGLVAALGQENVRLNGHPEKCLPNTLSISFRNVPANILLASIGEQVAASAGSACHANNVEISNILRAINLPVEWAMGTIRLSVGRGTTTGQIDQAISALAEAVKKLIHNPK